MVSAAVPGGPVSQSEIRVCAECGCIAPAEKTRCAACNTVFGPLSPSVQCPLPGRPWARVEFTMACPYCSAVVPLRPESIGAPVACGHCGQSADIDLGWWDEAMHLAHAAIDLSFPDFQGLNAPLGSYNPFAVVGQRESFLELPSEALPSQSPIRLRAGPGAPLCQRCRNPVAARFTAPGRLTSQCARCNDREAFSVPDVVTQRYPAVRALMAFSGEAAHAQGRVEPWWMLIEGLSYMRPMVQENKAQGERAQSEQQQWELWQRQEKERQESERRAHAEQAELARVEREKQEKEARARAEKAQAEQSLKATQDEAASERAAKEQAQAELAQMREFHQGEMDRMQREAWERSEQVRVEREQRDQRDMHLQMQRDEAARAQAEREKKLKTRTTVAYVLWALLFVIVLGDLALAMLK